MPEPSSPSEPPIPSEDGVETPLARWAAERAPLLTALLILAILVSILIIISLLHPR
ncbi:MAG TPA: hypothetical protein VF221_23120 [Chloroflexota bacterium]